MYLRHFKRAIDLVAAFIGLVAISPILIFAAFAIKLNDPGPIIFRQVRIGRDGAHFTLFKFRSMPTGVDSRPSDQIGSVTLTPLGKFLRRTSLDELPQLFNVLQGKMSLVGPRPPLPSQDDLVEARRMNGALGLRPGLTGWAQVNSFDGMTPTQKAALDGEYARRISLKFDLYILVRTIGYLLKSPPVY